MSQIPRLLEVLASTRSDALLIVEGAVITLQRPDGTHPLTKQPLAAAQWRALAAEIIPAMRVDSIGNGESVEQVVSHGGNDYAARVWREGSVGQIEVRASHGRTPDSSAPPPVSPLRVEGAVPTGAFVSPAEPGARAHR